MHDVNISFRTSIHIYHLYIQNTVERNHCFPLLSFRLVGQREHRDDGFFKVSQRAITFSSLILQDLLLRKCYPLAVKCCAQVIILHEQCSVTFMCGTNAMSLDLFNVFKTHQVSDLWNHYIALWPQLPRNPIQSSQCELRLNLLIACLSLHNMICSMTRTKVL